MALAPRMENIKVKRCHNTFTTLPTRAYRQNRIILLRTRYIYIMTDVSMVWWLPKWVYTFVVDYAVVRTFGCSKPEDGNLLNQGQWVTILDSDRIECSIRGGCRGVAWPNKSLSKVLVKELLEYRELVLRYPPVRGLLPGQKLGFVVAGSVWGQLICLGLREDVKEVVIFLGPNGGWVCSG